MIVVLGFFFLAIQTLAPKALAQGLTTPPTTSETAKEGEAFDLEYDCTRLPGGNAPVNRISRMEVKLSVDNLNFTYFGKPLHALTKEDFTVLQELVPHCMESTNVSFVKAIVDLQTAVTEAQETCARSLEWIAESVARADALQPSSQGVKELHNIWTSMLNRQLEMLPNDFRFLAEHLSKRRTELYAAFAPKRTFGARSRLKSPFEPGPVEPRRVDN
jgi:hypothetical protein